MSWPLLAFYGDDFTGSADVMEVLQWNGLRTVLFLEPPSPRQLAAYEDLRAFGVAGWSRSMSGPEMEALLTPVLHSLHASGAAIVHYKTCSTFDSSPEIGSVGRALELGRAVFGSGIVPIVVGAPNLGRYQVFGNLFARSGLDTKPYRLDRHPTMRQHPITPMAEADLRIHLAAQTRLRVGLYDVLRLNEPLPANHSDAWTNQDIEALLFDVLYPEHLPRIGAAIAELVAQDPPRLVVGSSGVEYALTEHWRRGGELDAMRSHPAGRPTFAASEQLLVVTGSCSPVNERQIAWAEEHGFQTIALDTARLVNPRSSGREIEGVVDRALELLQRGANVILHSSRGPNDPRVAETTEAFRSLGCGDDEIKLRAGPTLGPRLGEIVGALLAAHPLTRVGVAGGDTSGHVARSLGLAALEAIAPVAPGSPLCRAHAENALQGTEFFFKGGQVGRDDVWGTMLSGTR